MQVVEAVRASRLLQALVLLATVVLLVVVVDVVRLAAAVSGCMDWQGPDPEATDCGRPTWSIHSPMGLTVKMLAFDVLLLVAVGAIALGVRRRSTVAAVVGTLILAVVPFFLAPRMFVTFYPVVLALAIATTVLVHRKAAGGPR